MSDISIARHIKMIEEERQSRVLVFACSNVEIDLLPMVYDALDEIGHVDKLDIVLYCRGGVVNAARRLVLLLHEFTDHLSFLVPHHCESAGTIMSLGAHEIIAGPMASFSPIDPLLNAANAGDGDQPGALSAQDIRLFGEMVARWFGLDERDANAQSLSVLTRDIFPTTLTSFYRSTLELQQIGGQLLRYQLPQERSEKRAQIVSSLLFDYHSHSYALTRDELSALGLNVERNAEVEALAWALSRHIRALVGAGVRTSVEEDWNDTLIASRNAFRLRKRQAGSPLAHWHTKAV